MRISRSGLHRGWMTGTAAFSAVAMSAAMLTPAPASAQSSAPPAATSPSIPTPPAIKLPANAPKSSPFKAPASPPPPASPHNVPLPASALPPHSSTDPVAAAIAQAQMSGQRVEIVARRSETDTTYANPDGTLTTDLSAGPVRIARGNTFVPVDPTLVAANGTVSPRATQGTIALSGGSTTGGAEVAAITTAGKHLGLGWLGALPAPIAIGGDRHLPRCDQQWRPGGDGHHHRFRGVAGVAQSPVGGP